MMLNIYRRCASTGAAVALLAVGAHAFAADDAWNSPAAAAHGPIVFQAVAVTDEVENPRAAGKAAAEALKKAMGDAPLRAVILSEAFEDEENKAKLLEGVTSVLPKEMVFGQATYGSFAQAGCFGPDSVCLLGIGGEGIAVAARLVTNLGTARLVFDQESDLIRERLHKAGAALAGKFTPGERNRLLILLADAHSPKNQFLVEGVQQGLGKQFPMTGGCANKNAGQTFIYFGGRMLADSALGLMLSGDFRVSLAGRMAKENDAVIATANQSAAAALAGLKGKPLAALAFDCAGRKGKLKNLADELNAIKQALGTELGLFGCYCAGEIGPLDTPDKPAGALVGGGGWHVMFTILGR